MTANALTGVIAGGVTPGVVGLVKGKAGRLGEGGLSWCLMNPGGFGKLVPGQYARWPNLLT